MIEFNVEMGYLLKRGELDGVILMDENRKHKPMTFIPEARTESRYTQLFGTPEKAARTLVNKYIACNDYGCWYCPAENYCLENDDYDELLKWLNEEVKHEYK